jgi:hypothetical protein
MHPPKRRSHFRDKANAKGTPSDISLPRYAYELNCSLQETDNMESKRIASLERARISISSTT